VTYEARGSGCVLLVSDASGAVCEHMKNGLIHPSRDVEALTGHIRQLDQDRALLARLRAASGSDLDRLTWDEAGRRLAEIYRTLGTREA
jgi:glycosyltransferase involved in cell wall biosynthesis